MIDVVVDEVSSSSSLRWLTDYNAGMGDRPLGLLQASIGAYEAGFSIFISNLNKSMNLSGLDTFKY